MVDALSTEREPAVITAHKEIELAVRMSAQHPEPAELLAELRAGQVEVHACTSYQDRSQMVVLLIADNPSRAQELLRQAGYECKRQMVILIELAPYNPGLLIQLRAALERAGVSILSSHLCSSGARGLSLVVQTTDNERAFAVLEHARQSVMERPPLDSHDVLSAHAA
jgi:hypothetical protein